MSLVFEADIPDLKYVKKGKKRIAKASTVGILLLAYADHANDYGKSCYPGYRRLERKTKLSRQGIADTIEACVQNNYLILDGKSELNTNSYQINLGLLRSLNTPIAESSHLTPASQATGLGRVKPLDHNHPLTIIKEYAPSVRQPSKPKPKPKPKTKTVYSWAEYRPDFAKVRPARVPLMDWFVSISKLDKFTSSEIGNLNKALNEADELELTNDDFIAAWYQSRGDGRKQKGFMVNSLRSLLKTAQAIHAQGQQEADEDVETFMGAAISKHARSASVTLPDGREVRFVRDVNGKAILETEE